VWFISLNLCRYRHCRMRVSGCESTWEWMFQRTKVSRAILSQRKSSEELTSRLRKFQEQKPGSYRNFCFGEQMAHSVSNYQYLSFSHCVFYINPQNYSSISQNSAGKSYRLCPLCWPLPKTANYFHVRVICHVGKYRHVWSDCRILFRVSFNKQLETVSTSHNLCGMITHKLLHNVKPVTLHNPRCV